SWSSSTKGQSSLKKGNAGVKTVLTNWSNMDIKGSVMLQGCFSGGTHNGGVKMIERMSSWMGVTVYANQSWGTAYSSFNSNYFDPNNIDNSHLQLGLPTGTDEKWRNPADYVDAINNIGKFTVAYPN